MISLSVNVNKIATLRNSRGGSVPSVIAAVDTCLDAGAPGITVHPRSDERHIRASDAIEIGERLAERARQGGSAAEYNIEGDPRPDLLDLVHRIRPTQCTLVPVTPGEITSHAGWPPGIQSEWVRGIVRDLKQAGIRVSLFVDPDVAAVRWAADLEADRIELYTEPFATAFSRGPESAAASFAIYREAAAVAHVLGMGINGGHDLDLENLTMFRTLPYLDEVSIGHALISRAVWVGLDRVVREYLEVLKGAS